MFNVQVIKKLTRSQVWTVNKTKSYLHTSQKSLATIPKIHWENSERLRHRLTFKFIFLATSSPLATKRSFHNFVTREGKYFSAAPICHANLRSPLSANCTGEKARKGLLRHCFFCTPKPHIFSTQNISSLFTRDVRRRINAGFMWNQKCSFAINSFQVFFLCEFHFEIVKRNSFLLHFHELILILRLYWTWTQFAWESFADHSVMVQYWVKLCDRQIICFSLSNGFTCAPHRIAKSFFFPSRLGGNVQLAPTCYPPAST